MGKVVLKPHHVNNWSIGSKEFRFDVYDSNDFSKLEAIKQVYVILLSKDLRKVILVKNRSGYWFLPGGGVEEGESLTDTLVREVKEETNCSVDLKSIKPLYYQKAFKREVDGEWEFKSDEVRFVATVDTVNKFEHDPDSGDTLEVKWARILDIDKYLRWGKTSDLIISKIKGK